MFHVGILQLTQNLDDAVYGFKEGLRELAIDAAYHYLNADGNTADLPRLAEKLAELNVDLIFACSTPAAQAAQNLAGQIPVLFTPVFDPVSVNLVDSLATPGGKTTGMSGMVRAADKVNFIRRLLPRARKLGVLYHTQDDNARIETENFLAAAEKQFSAATIAFDKQEELSLLEERLPEDLDALFLPIGKAVEDNFSSIAYYTDAARIPIIASHAPNVALGALGALVANHRTLGKSCARQAKQILADQVSPAKIAVGVTDAPEILLNAFVAENLGVDLPEQLRRDAKEIYA